MKKAPAEIIREYQLVPTVERVNGVTYDGHNIWAAVGDSLNAIDPESGATVRTVSAPAYAGSAFDGRHLFQIAEDRIQKIDPDSGRVLSTIPTPEGGAAGLAWAEGSLWVGQHRARKIHQLDPRDGKILRTIEAKRFVTGVTWVEGELWHATWEDEQSDIRRIDPQTGEVLEQLDMPAGVVVSGLDSNGGDTFFCGGGGSGKIRAVRKPKRSASPGGAGGFQSRSVDAPSGKSFR